MGIFVQYLRLLLTRVRLKHQNIRCMVQNEPNINVVTGQNDSAKKQGMHLNKANGLY